MTDANFLNPLLNPIFLPVLVRVFVFFVVGFIILFAIERFNISRFKKGNLGQRFFGWAILVPIYLMGIFLGGIPSLIMLFVFMYLAIKELARLAGLPKIYTYSLYILSIWSIVTASFYTQYFYSLPLLYFIAVTFCAIRENDAKKSLQNAAITLFISIWVIFGLSHSILLGHLNNSIDSTKSLLLLIIFATTFSDIGAYVFGKFFHKINFLDSYKVASNISPNKTYIGLTGHILGAGLGIAGIYFVVGSYMSVYHWCVVAVLVGIFGLVGGLTNSLFKRCFDSKDSGELIPGHGGVMDRLDSILRVVVVLYYYFLLVLN
ncbi:MAG: phosphatidate cytidylyltransferase [Candidatus Pacebacteria bacterium]|nr:phosphatidate cytidylyltransferase [Candidatus Paceibacterota bacterium]